MKPVIHKCKENDAVLKFQECDGKIDEVWLKDPIDGGWYVIGFKDLQEGIKKAKAVFAKTKKSYE